MIKKPKLYFTDTGLAAYLTKINSSEELQNSYINGAFFENFVLMEIKKSWVHNGREANFFFYRDLQRREIDLLIKEGATYYPIEIKMTQNPTADMVKSFQVLAGGKLKCGPGALISLTNTMRYLTPDVISQSIYDI